MKEIMEKITKQREELNAYREQLEHEKENLKFLASGLGYELMALPEREPASLKDKMSKMYLQVSKLQNTAERILEFDSRTKEIAKEISEDEKTLRIEVRRIVKIKDEIKAEETKLASLKTALTAVQGIEDVANPIKAEVSKSEELLAKKKEQLQQLNEVVAFLSAGETSETPKENTEEKTETPNSPEENIEAKPETSDIKEENTEFKVANTQKETTKVESAETKAKTDNNGVNTEIITDHKEEDLNSSKFVDAIIEESEKSNEVAQNLEIDQKVIKFAKKYFNMDEDLFATSRFYGRDYQKIVICDELLANLPDDEVEAGIKFLESSLTVTLMISSDLFDGFKRYKKDEPEILQRLEAAEAKKIEKVGKYPIKYKSMESYRDAAKKYLKFLERSMEVEAKEFAKRSPYIYTA